MNEYELTGSYYEMGQRYGALLRRTGFYPRPASPEQLRFSRECEAVVQEHTPELLDELRGVSDGGSFDPELVKVLPLTLYAESGCSLVAISGEHTRDGSPLFGRNYDFFASFGEYSTLFRTRPEGRLAHVGCSDHYVGRHDGVNEAGLAIGHSGPPGRERRPGFMFTLAIRAVLDNCRTVAEASTLLERIPHIQNTSFLVADAMGDVAAVDASPEEVRTIRPANGFGFLANRFASDAMKIYEPDERVPNDESRARNFNNWFEAHRDLIVEDIQLVLADTEEGVCVCANEDEGTNDPAVTLWSWTATLTPGGPGIQLAKGTPNEAPYEPVAL